MFGTVIKVPYCDCLAAIGSFFFSVVASKWLAREKKMFWGAICQVTRK